MQQACAALAEYADSLSAHFAIETGPEPSERLRKFLDSLGSRGVAVNFDPANLQMVWKEDAAAAVKNLAPYIVHTHAKDGRQLYFRSSEEIYGIVQPEPDAVISPSFEELPLGEGDVDFKGWLDALRGIGYNSFLTIEREVGGNPEADIRKAVEYLQMLI